MIRSSRVELALAAVLALALAPGVGAREGDREQPATIEADRAEIDRASGASRYYGDVVFVQGTLRITGDTLSVRAPDGVVQWAETHGEPARVRQETDAGRVVRARGRHIEYDADARLVTLTGDAVLLRGGEHFAAEKIRYWLDTERVEGAGQDEAEERVHIRIEPDEESGDEAGSPDDGRTGADGGDG